MLESKTSEVGIADVEPSVLKVLLEFIYTGHCVSLWAGTSSSLTLKLTSELTLSSSNMAESSARWRR